MITAVIINWARPDNVKKIVDTLHERESLISEIIVWDNRFDQPPIEVDADLVVRTSKDPGLYTRFLAGCLATNDAVLIHDDDVMAPKGVLDAMYKKWLQTPQIIHGIHGRVPLPNNRYARPVRGNLDVPIVLTLYMLVHRQYCGEFFCHVRNFDPIQRQGKPYGNGEDIIMSYVVQYCSGRLNRIHKLPLSNLPAPAAISAGNGHYEHRTALMRACMAWLKTARQQVV